jgi:hypothetical protein
MDTNCATMEALANIPTLTELHFENPVEASGEDFRDVAPILSLRALTMAYVDADSARWISGAVHLRELKVWMTTVTPEIIQSVASLKELETLSLAACENVDHVALEALVEMPRLRALELPIYSITWETLETLRRMPRLESVDLAQDGQSWIVDADLREAFYGEWGR